MDTITISVLRQLFTYDEWSLDNLLEYLRDGLWVKLARQANAAMTELARGLRAIAADPSLLDSTWPGLTKIAIDHAVAEPAADADDARAASRATTSERAPCTAASVALSNKAIRAITPSSADDFFLTVTPWR